MIVPYPCEAFPGVCEDRYIDVCTFRTRYWKAGSAGFAVVLLAGIGCSVAARASMVSELIWLCARPSRR